MHINLVLDTVRLSEPLPEVSWLEATLGPLEPTHICGLGLCVVSERYCNHGEMDCLGILTAFGPCMIVWRKKMEKGYAHAGIQPGNALRLHKKSDNMQ